MQQTKFLYYIEYYGKVVIFAARKTTKKIKLQTILNRRTEKNFIGIH